MQDSFIKAEEFAGHLKDYVNNRIASLKLQTAEKTSKFFSNLIAVTIVAAIMLVFVIFVSLAAAYALSNWLGESYSGFLIVGVIWLLIATIIWISRERLLRIPIMNKMLHEMFKDEEDS